MNLPTDVLRNAISQTKKGVQIAVTPKEVMQKLRLADKALNGTSNDDEHDVLFQIREWLSEIYEDPDRRKR
jgi:hypothetical protein